MTRFPCIGILFACAVAVGLCGFFACSNEDDIFVQSELAPPTSFRTASSDGRVILCWSPSPDARSNDFVGYRIVTESALRMLVDSANTSPTTSSYAVRGLVKGELHTSTIQSIRSNGLPSQKVTVQWCPAEHHLLRTFCKYESIEPSGLQFLAGQRFIFAISKSTIRVFQQRWRHTLLVETTASSFDDVIVVPDVSAFSSMPGLPIVSGKVYVAIMKGSKYAKFRVESPGVQLDPVNNKRFVNITVVYDSGAGNFGKAPFIAGKR